MPFNHCIENIRKFLIAPKTETKDSIFRVTVVAFEDKCSIEIDTGKVVKGKALDDQKVRNQLVCDYIAGMTDNFAVETFEEIYIPRSWGFDNYVETDY